MQCDSFVPAVEASLLFIQHAKTTHAISKENMLVCQCGEKWKRNCDNYITILLGVMTRISVVTNCTSPLRLCGQEAHIPKHVHFICFYTGERII